jgi:general secretion pathway protein C
LPSFTLFAALLLLTWLLAHWTWVFLTPRQQGVSSSASVPVLSKVLAEKAVGLQLFGGGASSEVSGESAPVAVVSSIGVRGVYSTRDGRTGFAVLEVDGKPISAITGQEFLPGLVLQRVYPDSVDILRGGQVETARMAAPTGSAVNAALPSNTAGTSTALQMTVRQLGPQQYGFSRAALLAMLKRADQMALLGRYGPHPRGGALLERSPAGGLPEKLGLKVGDVVTGINGKPLSGPGDVARLYELLIKSERVSVDVLRAGEKMKYGLQVSP